MPRYLIEASFGNVDVAVAHLHVDPQAPYRGQAVLVISQVLKERTERRDIRSEAELKDEDMSQSKTSQRALIT